MAIIDNLRTDRRWCQISLRAIFFSVALIGVVFGWIAHKMRQGTEQKVAVEEIVRLGGRVWYDYQIDPEGAVIREPNEPAPSWIVKLFGRDFVANVTDVYLDECQVTDADLKILSGLRRLKNLSLERTQITDIGVSYISGLSQIQSLELGHTGVTDAGLIHVEGLVRLNRLWLQGTHINGTGLVHLRRLHDLQCLRLDYTEVSDSGLVYLIGSRNLLVLWLQNTKVTDSGCRKLEEAIPNLTIHQRK
jgi:hypothetical protein